MITIPSVDMQKKTTGNVVPLNLSKILEEDAKRQKGILRENGCIKQADDHQAPAYPRVSKKQKERLTYQIENHPRLSLGQKEQALYFLLSPTYPRSGYAIAQNYIKLCLSPKYIAKGSAWRN